LECLLDFTHGQVTSVAERKHIKALILAQSQISSGQVDPAEVVDTAQWKPATRRAFDFN